MVRQVLLQKQLGLWFWFRLGLWFGFWFWFRLWLGLWFWFGLWLGLWFWWFRRIWCYNSDCYC